VNAEATSAAYPGNLTLPAEVRQKILSTFRHTLDLYRDGKLDDCLIGCDFILKMDPRFVPARRLQEKARNPKSDVDVEELESVIAPPVAAPATPPAAADPAAAPRATRSGSRDTNPVGLPEMAPLSDAETAATGGNLEGLEDLSLDSLSLDAPLGDRATDSGAGNALQADEPEPEFDSLAQSPFAESGFAPLQISPQEEIASLLKKGDEAHAAGDPQQAIEIWSRIFLLDINNYGAVERIERVRGEMAEESRHAATPADGPRESATASFDPSILAMEANSPRPTPVAPLPGSFAPPPPGVTLTPHDLSGVATPADVLAEEMDQSGPPGGRRSWTSIPVPPRGSAPDVTAAPSASVPAGLLGKVRGLNPRLAMIAGAALVVVAAGVFFLTRPSGGAAPVTAPESGPTLARATRLFQEGKIEETTAELRRIPRGHPDYDRAQKLLASLPDPKERSVQPVPESAAAASAAREAGGADPAALRADAERAFAEKRYIDAMKSFSLAAPHFQGDPTFAQAMGAASEKVSELTPAVKLYNDGEYETAIPILWRIYSASRDNVDARSYLMRSYFNQGVLQLQNGLYDKARESFGEVLSLDPQDTEAARHRQFAERYRSGDLDLMGRIYVRYISPRS
jgi:tetratricopeptide (TPR) repeat protein